MKALQRGLRILREARQNGHLDGESLTALGSALLALRRSGEAAQVLQGVLDDDPDHPLARFRLGIVWDQARQYEQAIREYETVIRAVPAWMEPYPLLARLYLFRGQSGTAVELLKQQLRYDPDANTYARLALAEHLEGAPAKTCLSLLDEALGRDPRSVLAYLYRAEVYTAAGRFHQARASYHKALEIDPENQIARTGVNRLPR
jgi:tetratricopeptide (TPR) repeat protein